jgi:hypothetical protein
VTDEQKQEMISREFVKVLAYAHGFKVLTAELDHGVDMVICPVTERAELNGKTRFLDSPYKLDFQLKSTTSAGISTNENEIRYDLEAKTYNDLVAIRSDILPLHLVVVVFDSRPPDCIHVNDSQLGLLGRAFWFLPELDDVPTNNTTQIRITIPKVNLLGSTFVRECYDRLGIEL